ncbi:MAG: hypothetical protein ABL900_00860 [Burkholderiaceae bacterium]
MSEGALVRVTEGVVARSMASEFLVAPARLGRFESVPSQQPG